MNPQSSLAHIFQWVELHLRLAGHVAGNPKVAKQSFSPSRVAQAVKAKARSAVPHATRAGGGGGIALLRRERRVRRTYGFRLGK